MSTSEEQTPHWEWWPVPLGRGSAARYLCRGDVLTVAEKVKVEFCYWLTGCGHIFLCYMVAVWEVLSAPSAKISHTGPWSIFF